MAESCSSLHSLTPHYQNNDNVQRLQDTSVSDEVDVGMRVHPCVCVCVRVSASLRCLHVSDKPRESEIHYIRLNGQERILESITQKLGANIIFQIDVGSKHKCMLRCMLRFMLRSDKRQKKNW